MLLAATSNTVNFAAFAKNMKNVYFSGGAAKDGKAGVAYLRKAERIDVGKGGGARASGWKKMTNKEATEAAKKLGFEPVNERNGNQQKIFYNKKTKTYMSPDATGHNGGIWKQANTIKKLSDRAKRAGTYDANLKRIGD